MLTAGDSNADDEGAHRDSRLAAETRGGTANDFVVTSLKYSRALVTLRCYVLFTLRCLLTRVLTCTLSSTALRI